MRSIEALLPAYGTSRGLSCLTLARRVYGREPADAEVASIGRAAQRLVKRGVADSTFTHDGLKVYFRAEGAVFPAGAASPEPDIDAVVILDRLPRRAGMRNAGRR